MLSLEICLSHDVKSCSYCETTLLDTAPSKVMKQQILLLRQPTLHITDYPLG